MMFLRSKVTIGGRIRKGSYYFSSHRLFDRNRIYYTILDDEGEPLCLPGKYFDTTIYPN